MNEDAVHAAIVDLNNTVATLEAIVGRLHRRVIELEGVNELMGPTYNKLIRRVSDLEVLTLEVSTDEPIP